MKSIVLLVHGDRNGDASKALSDMIQVLQKDFFQDKETLLVGAQLLSFKEELFLPVVLESIVQKGILNIQVIPWFLFSGPHVKQDIPELIAQFKEKHPQVQLTTQSPVGEDPLFTDILRKRISNVH